MLTSITDLLVSNAYAFTITGLMVFVGVVVLVVYVFAKLAAKCAQIGCYFIIESIHGETAAETLAVQRGWKKPTKKR